MSDQSAARVTGTGNRRSLLFVAQATAVVVGVLVLANLFYRVRSGAVLRSSCHRSRCSSRCWWAGRSAASWAP